MQYRTLGNTGLTVSELGFGCIPIIRLDTREAITVLRHAYDRGITFYDTANAYRDSENKIGQAFAGMRDKVVIATKSGHRLQEGVNDHLENSLRMLQSDYIDLYQLHQVSKEEDFETILGTGGALEALTAAKAAGKIRHIGVTSHSLPMALRLMKLKLFSTIQFPFNFIEHAAQGELRQLAQQLNMGFIVMKPFAGGMIDSAEVAFTFLRQFPDALPIPGFDSTAGVDEIVNLYSRPNEVTEAALAAMDKYRSELGKQFCRRCEYCQPCPSGVMITPAMGYQVITKRMSPAVAVKFMPAVMESVANCTECGACIPRCPYDLPIPEMLKRHYAMYQEHLTNHS